MGYIRENLKNIFLFQIFEEIKRFFVYIKDRTDTRLYSDEAIIILQDPKNVKKLNTIVDEYHKTGEWDYKEINNLTNRTK